MNDQVRRQHYGVSINCTRTLREAFLCATALTEERACFGNQPCSAIQHRWPKTDRRRSKVQQGRFCSARKILLNKEDSARLEDSTSLDMVRRGRAHLVARSLARAVEEYAPNGLPMGTTGHGRAELDEKPLPSPAGEPKNLLGPAAGYCRVAHHMGSACTIPETGYYASTVGNASMQARLRAA